MKQQNLLYYIHMTGAENFSIKKHHYFTQISKRTGSHLLLHQCPWSYCAEVFVQKKSVIIWQNQIFYGSGPFFNASLLVRCPPGENLKSYR